MISSAIKTRTTIRKIKWQEVIWVLDGLLTLGQSFTLLGMRLCWRRERGDAVSRLLQPLMISIKIK